MQSIKQTHQKPPKPHSPNQPNPIIQPSQRVHPANRSNSHEPRHRRRHRKQHETKRNLGPEPKIGRPGLIGAAGNQEKPEKPSSNLASMGIYIFSRKLLFQLLEEEKKTATDFGKEIIPDSINKYKVVSYQYDGYWTDIGNIYSFFEANLALTLDIPPFNFVNINFLVNF